ncbi:hypothetical protein BLAHAN_07118 [Blautia hansenii DSM 20583]|uniref:Uncharacterized protein n=1 Tax=Blautia hansenii DSM 20583 TaxID=537007 RepID=C9LCG0_BLAHA|nr:hypothetical protein BLAHAN_07118 [Blautia hansenii DSM 20583]
MAEYSTVCRNLCKILLVFRVLILIIIIWKNGIEKKRICWKRKSWRIL